MLADRPGTRTGYAAPSYRATQLVPTVLAPPTDGAVALPSILAEAHLIDSGPPPSDSEPCAICLKHTEPSDCAGFVRMPKPVAATTAPAPPQRVCRHTFCSSCAAGWTVHTLRTGETPRCPLCRAAYQQVAKLTFLSPLS